MDSLLWYKGHEVLIGSVTKAEGLYIYDENGKRYADMEAGVWCLPLGHRCAAVDNALIEQMSRVTHTGYCYTAPVVREAARKILSTAGLDEGICCFLTSGSEAVETGVQIIKTVTGKKYLLTLEDSFLGSHGSASKKSPDEWHLFNWQECTGCSASECGSCAHFQKIPFGLIGGFVFEPGSSSGLVRFAPADLIKNIAAQIREAGGLILANEVTTGLGRTGKMYGYEHYNLQPDMVAVGKGVGNGYPVSALLMSADVAQSVNEKNFKAAQSHQNDPAGAAVVSAVLDEFEKQDIIGQSSEKGAYLKSKLIELAKKYPVISEVRGRGLMCSVTFENISDGAVYDIFKRMLDSGFIIVKRPGLKVIRLDPPLIIQKEEIDSFCLAFDSVLGSVCSK